MNRTPDSLFKRTQAWFTGTHPSLRNNLHIKHTELWRQIDSALHCKLWHNSSSGMKAFRTDVTLVFFHFFLKESRKPRIVWIAEICLVMICHEFLNIWMIDSTWMSVQPEDVPMFTELQPQYWAVDLQRFTIPLSHGQPLIIGLQRDIRLHRLNYQAYLKNQHSVLQRLSFEKSQMSLLRQRLMVIHANLHPVLVY